MVAEIKNIKISDEETIAKFEEIKTFLGLKNDAEVLRFLINWFLRQKVVISNV
jgi:hypothetical protein